MRTSDAFILGTRVLAGALLCGVPMPAAAQPPSGAKPPVNEYGAAVKEFRDRADAYLEQQKDIAKGLPPLKNTEDPAELTSREDELGKRIALARATADRKSVV